MADLVAALRRVRFLKQAHVVLVKRVCEPGEELDVPEVMALNWIATGLAEAIQPLVEAPQVVVKPEVKKLASRGK